MSALIKKIINSLKCGNLFLKLNYENKGVIVSNRN